MWLMGPESNSASGQEELARHPFADDEEAQPVGVLPPLPLQGGGDLFLALFEQVI